MIATPSKTAAKFREIAKRLETEIAAKRGNRRENTPKQQREATAQRIEANHLERAMKALTAMADAHESGTFPGFLVDVKTKAQVLQFLRTRLISNSYYHIGDSGGLRPVMRQRLVPNRAHFFTTGDLSCTSATCGLGTAFNSAWPNP